MQSVNFSTKTYYPPKPETMSTQTIESKNKSELHFRKYCSFFQKSNHLFQTIFLNNPKM